MPHTFFSAIRTAHLMNLLCFVGLEDNSLTTKHEPGKRPGKPSRLRLALRLATSTRGVGTKWQVKNIPPFPAWVTSADGSVDRMRFLIRQTAILMWQYLALDLLYFGYFARFYQLQSFTHAPGTEFLGYYNPTAIQQGARLAIAIVFMVALRLLLDWAYRCFSVISVGIKLTPPEDWPPLFGSIANAYTLRNFWGAGKRYTELILMFTLSAGFHYMSAIWCDFPGHTGFLLIMTLHPFIIMLEDGIQSYVRRYVREGNGLLRYVLGKEAFRRLIGYGWVAFAGLYVTVPWCAFPIMRLPVYKTVLVPHSLVERLGLTMGTLTVGSLGVALHYIFKMEV
ncbi:uncharacterized protein NFIA_002240 [Aspergillus fischeri NRRL 181]|uniref:Wax synthase domain-containing protein n=1 Tax=Neosartorya fischeri (strain ATCC 1020 / DSM 3700 / CBS 544.65 / FGSC A1164 / JCM 1740 / NRRL 181 / WB 181) TaxID=331117 RepID=A1DJI5_NEOFI|nr:uncharacterized protein NFIA_002240 [Aspergillus fischeri NRRL 181]EAW16874.1 hypothetical protein NFIA_002240 [Aspergillus fischeri NRRL 181]KAG2019037.1 hypothetical protein GB937_005326 [Aspergillus fischeri]